MNMKPAKTALILGVLALIQSGLLAGPLAKVNPAHFSGTGWPALNQMTKISTDPAHDNKTDYLDIVADYFCFSDTKFYAAIQNRGGGFPTSGKLGLEYYSYMVLIANSADKKYVWVMNYMKVPAAKYKPGVYRIEVKKDQDLIRIGDISTQLVPDSNLLKMSCSISTLLADPLFKSWYNSAKPAFSMHSQSFRTTVIPFGTKQQDGTDPGKELNLLKK